MKISSIIVAILAVAHQAADAVEFIRHRTNRAAEGNASDPVANHSQTTHVNKRITNNLRGRGLEGEMTVALVKEDDYSVAKQP